MVLTLTPRFTESLPAIVAEAIVDTVIAKVIKLALLYVGHFGIYMDVAQRIEHTTIVQRWESQCCNSVFPKNAQYGLVGG